LCQAGAVDRHFAGVARPRGAVELGELAFRHVEWL
jgi:hypothetical protein